MLSERLGASETSARELVQAQLADLAAQSMANEDAELSRLKLSWIQQYGAWIYCTIANSLITTGVIVPTS